MNKQEIQIAIDILTERQLRIALYAIAEGKTIQEAISIALTYPTT